MAIQETNQILKEWLEELKTEYKQKEGGLNQIKRDIRETQIKQQVIERVVMVKQLNGESQERYKDKFGYDNFREKILNLREQERNYWSENDMGILEITITELEKMIQE